MRIWDEGVSLKNPKGALSNFPGVPQTSSRNFASQQVSPIKQPGHSTRYPAKFHKTSNGGSATSIDLLFTHAVTTRNIASAINAIDARALIIFISNPALVSRFT